MSYFFKVSTGFRQGDPFLSTSFVLSMQCLANFVKQNFVEQDIIYKGVVIGLETLKFIMFADDVLLFP